MTDLDWPPEFGERTPARQREPNRSYEVTLAQSLDDLEAELDRLGVDDLRYSFDAQQRQRDGRPYSRANPDDPGFVVRWTVDGDQYAVGCDAYDRLRDNVRTVGLYVREKRKMEQRPVETGEAEFSNLRLPGPEDTDVVAAEPPPHEVLEVDPDASPQVVRAAYREQVKRAHPDQGGTAAELKRVREAKEAMLDD